MSTPTIDQQFIEFVVKSLVSKPDAVIVDRIIDEKGVLLTLTVDPEDLGRVIGKRGATAQSLRTLLRALGTKNEARYNLKIFDNGVPRPERTDRPEQGDYRRDDRRDERPAQNTETVEKAEDSWGTSEPSSNETTSSDDEGMASAPAKPEEKREEPTEDSGFGSEDAIAKTRKELEDLDDLDI